jgi:TPP-dependent pyruvate/acetoin dehydrogenase alpha subunit
MKSWSKAELISFEQKIAQAFDNGEIKYPIHLSNGNEDDLISLFKDIKTKDWVFCSWRSHYQALLKGVPEKFIEEAIRNGKSISMSFPDFNFFSTAIVGGQVPIALGVALGIKMVQGIEHVYCFLGDMTSQTGIARASISYAENFELPITFVIEDNNKSVCTDTRKTWGTEKLDYEIRNSKKVQSYKYSSKFPHAGAGKRVQF